MLLLSRGAITLPQRDDISLHITVQFDANNSATSTPKSRALLCFKIAANGDTTATSSNLDHSTLTAAPSARLSSKKYRLQSADLDVDIVILVAPWDQPVDWRQELSPNRRTIVLSAAGFRDDLWFDGPLAHVIPNGAIASYLPTGGAGALLMPLIAQSTLSGLAYDSIGHIEGDAGLRGHRSLLAAIKHQLAHCESDLNFQIDSLDRRSAVELTLVRQAFPSTRIVVQFAEKPTPQWRRLLQNLNVHAASGDTISYLPLPALVTDACAADLVHSINLYSDIIPAKLAAQA